MIHILIYIQYICRYFISYYTGFFKNVTLRQKFQYESYNAVTSVERRAKRFEAL